MGPPGGAGAGATMRTLRILTVAGALALLVVPATADVRVMGTAFQGTLAPGETDQWRHGGAGVPAFCVFTIVVPTTVVLVVETPRAGDVVVLWGLDPETWRWVPHEATGVPPTAVARTAEPEAGCPWFDVEGRALGGEVAYTVVNCGNRACAAA